MDEQNEPADESAERSRAPRYEWAADPDEERRAFIFEHMANADIDGEVLITNMQRAFKWLKLGEMPPAKRKPPKVVAVQEGQ